MVVMSEGQRWPPLVGRNPEIKRMRALIDRAISGMGHLELISGEAGIGKTRLAQEVTSVANDAGFLCLSGRCLPGPSFPYLPFAEALSGIREKAETHVISHHLGTRKRMLEALPRWEGLAPTEMSRSSDDPRLYNDRVFYGSLGILKGASLIAPVLLVLDDFHWADSSSINLLHFLARSIHRTRILILVLYRSEEVIEGSPLARELKEGLRTLQDERAYGEIWLKPFEWKEIETFSSLVLEDQVDEELVDYLDQRTDGNPLFMVELLRMLSAMEDLDRSDEGCRLSRRHEPQVPSTIQEVVMRRVDMLPKNARRVIEAASIIPEAFEPSVLREILGLSTEDLDVQIRSLMADYHFIIFAEGRVQFGHEQVRQVVHDSISNRRRVQLHLEIGKVLEKDAKPALYGKLAQHFCIASDNARCLKYSFLAGQLCLTKCAWKETVPYLEKSLRLLDDHQDDDVKIGIILEGLGDAQREMGNIPLAADYYVRLLETQLGPEQRARGLRKSAEIWVQGGLEGGMEEAMHKLDEAESIIGTEHSELGEINWSRATILFSAGKFREADAMFHKAERLMVKLRKCDRLAWEMTHHATVHLTLAEVQESLTLLGKAQKIYAEHPYPSAEVELFLLLGESYLYSGDEESALRQFASCIERSDALGYYHFSRWSHFYRALIFESRGEKMKALKEMEKCQKVDERTRTPHSRLVPCMLAAHLMVSTGQLSKAEAFLKEGMDLLDDYKIEVRTPIRGLTIAVLAELLSAQGSYDESRAEFERALGLLSDVWGGLFFEALVREWYALSLLASGGAEDSARQIISSAAIHRQLGNLTKAEELESSMAEIRKELGRSDSS